MGLFRMSMLVHVLVRYDLSTAGDFVLQQRRPVSAEKQFSDGLA